MNISNFSWAFNSFAKNIKNDSGKDNVVHFEQEPRNYRIAFCVINVVLCFTALLGNSAILITIWKKSSLQSASNIFLSSLAVSDLTVGLIVQPLFVEYIVITLYKPTGTALHFNILSSMLCAVSFLTITAIGIDRLLALQLHLRYQAVVTPFRATLAAIFIWVFCRLISTIWLWSFNLAMRVTLILIISALVVNFAVFWRIYLIVRRHQRQIQQQLHHQQQANNGNILSLKRFTKSALNTFLLYILLLCCYAPFSVYVGTQITSHNFYITTVTLLFLNSTLNPLFYSWRDREIRAAMKQVFCPCLQPAH